MKQDARTLAEQARIEQLVKNHGEHFREAATYYAPMRDAKLTAAFRLECRAALEEFAQSQWIKITDDPDSLPPKYSSWLIAHKETGDGTPIVEEAQWNGNQWVLARTAPQDDMIFIGEQAYAYMAIPAAPPEDK